MARRAMAAAVGGVPGETKAAVAPRARHQSYILSRGHRRAPRSHIETHIDTHYLPDRDAGRERHGEKQNTPRSAQAGEAAAVAKVGLHERRRDNAISCAYEAETWPPTARCRPAPCIGRRGHLDSSCRVVIQFPASRRARFGSPRGQALDLWSCAPEGILVKARRLVTNVITCTFLCSLRACYAAKASGDCRRR